MNLSVACQQAIKGHERHVLMLLMQKFPSLLLVVVV